MTRRKISLIIEAAKFGGTEVYVENLAHYLSRRGYPVEIIVLSGETCDAQQRFPDFDVFIPTSGASLRRHLKACNSIASLHLYSSLLKTTMTAKRAGVPVVTTLHQPLEPWNAFYRLQWRLAIALCDIHVGVSAACLDRFGPFAHGKPQYVLPGPLPFGQMPSARFQEASQDPFLIAYVGRLSKEKDLSVLFNAVAIADNIKLLIIGDGPEMESLKALGDKLRLYVEFKGKVDRSDVFKNLQNAHAFVLPSKFEGLGLAAIEAMALGVPTIVSDFPASKEYIIAGETGLSFPVGDPVALNDQINRLKDDEALRKTLSDKGATFVRETFDEDTQYGPYATLFEKL